jgi:hypothetical protein
MHSPGWKRGRRFGRWRAKGRRLSFRLWRRRVLSFGEGHFDGIEIGTVGRQEQNPCAPVANGFFGGLAFMRRQIVHDDDVAGLEGRGGLGFDIGSKMRRSIGASMTKGAVRAEQRRPAMKVWVLTSTKSVRVGIYSSDRLQTLKER